MKCLIIEHNNLGKHTAGAAFSICGEIKDVEGIEFLNNTKPDDLLKNLRDFKKNLNDGEELYILVDFIGGTPFNAAMRFKMQNPDLKIFVIAGFNMTVVIEMCMAIKLNLPFEAEKILKKGRDALKIFD